MTALEDHPQGQDCVNGLYATFDPDFRGTSFMTVPYYEDNSVVVWVFTADWLGTEDDEGEPYAAGLVSVTKQASIVSIWTWYPVSSFSILIIPPEE